MLFALVAATAGWAVPARAQPPDPAQPAAKPDGDGGKSGSDFKLGDATAGKTIYTSYCAVCHGTTGKGNGPGAAALKPGPPDFTSKSWANGITNKQIYEVIRGGGPAVGRSAHMPSWKGRLSDSEIRNVAAYVRSFSQ